jgi:hypothetical protein
MLDLHLRLQFLEPLAAEAIEVDAVLPVSSGLAVQAAWIPLVGLPEEADVHSRSRVDLLVVPSHEITHLAPSKQIGKFTN